MSDNHPRPQPDVLEQAIAALRDAPTPAEPPAELTAATLAAVHNHLAGSVPDEVARRLQRRAKIMRYVRIGSLATAAAVLAAVGFLTLNPRSAVAMDKVLAKAVQAEAVRYDVRTEGALADHADTVTIRDKAVRVEGEVVSFIIDGKAGEMVILSHPNQVYQTVDLTAETGAIAPFDVFAVKFRDQLTALSKEKFEAVSKETVGDIKAGKFLANGVTSLGLTGDWTVWVDSKTELPVQIVVEATSNNGMKTKRTYGNFDWSPRVKAADFRLDPPEGYTEGTVFQTFPPLTPIKKKGK